jgi:hypothetical protein
MALYRTLRSLNHNGNRIERDRVLTLTWAQETIDRLVEVGALARISPPPLSELPGWKTRAGKLASHDILDAGQFLEAEEAMLTKALRCRIDTVQRLKEEVARWLQPEKEEGCCGG